MFYVKGNIALPNSNDKLQALRLKDEHYCLNKQRQCES